MATSSTKPRGTVKPAKAAAKPATAPAKAAAAPAKAGTAPAKASTAPAKAGTAPAKPPTAQVKPPPRRAVKPSAVDPAPSVAAGRALVPSRVSEEERWEMVARAAYFRAERRNFADGTAMQDWLEAEREIDALLRGENLP